MRAAIYARYSAGPNQTEASIEGQVKACQSFIKEKGYAFTKTYKDEHITGKTDKRPGFQAMLSDAEAGAFDVLVVYSIDRFSRGEYDLPFYRMTLNRAGVKIESAAERIPEGPEGFILQHVLEGLAVYYSMELSRKISRGMRTRAEKAIPNGGPTPFGYRLENGEYIIEEQKAGAIRKIFEMYADGSTMAGCARYLNGLGFKTSKGKPFTSGSVKRILTNRKYLGYYIYDDIEIKNGIPQIVNEEVWFLVQEKLKDNKPHGPKGYFPLTGKLICGKCGTDMIGISGTSKTGEVYRYYKCKGCSRKNIPAAPFEKKLAEHLREVLTDPQELEYITGKLINLQADKIASEVEYVSLVTNLEHVQKKLKRAVDQILENGPSKAIGEQIRDLETEEAALQRKIAGFKRQKVFTKDQIIKGIAAMFSEEMPDAELIEIAVNQVVLTDDRLVVSLNLLDGETLKTTELLGFVQSDEWWTICASGRTLQVCGHSMIAVFPQ